MTNEQLLEALRQRFLKLQRHNFLLDREGGINAVADPNGRWVYAEMVEALFDPSGLNDTIKAELDPKFKDPESWPVYLFHRGEGFYPVRLPDDSEVLANVECNPGTLLVEDMSGRVVWRKQ